MSSMIKKFILIAFVFPAMLLAEASSSNTASSPKNIVETAIDEIVVIVNEQEFPNKEEKRDAIYDVVEKVFNFEEMSKRSLGASWKKCTDQERDEFVETFSEFLAKTYIDRIDEVRHGMVSVNDEKIRGNKALVKTKIKLEEETFPIDYKMLKNGEDWQVYDVVIENVGLISNYRNEFAGIIRKEKFSGLIARLKEKNEKKSEAS